MVAAATPEDRRQLFEWESSLSPLEFAFAVAAVMWSDLKKAFRKEDE